MNDIYQQLGSQLGQRPQQSQGNPFASLMQQRGGQGQAMPQPQGNAYGYGGGGGNPFAALMQNLGRQAGGSMGQQYGSFQMPQTYRTGGQQMGNGYGLGAIASQLRGAPASPIPGYTTPAIDQRNQYANIPQAALDGTGWKDGINSQMFQQQNPYYGQTGYYGNLQQVQQQMAGRAQSASNPTGVLDASTYTQNPAGQPLWQPDLTPQQKVEQDLASWEANRWNPK